MMAQGVLPRAALTLAIVCAWYCGIQGVFAKEKSEIKKSTRLPLLLVQQQGRPRFVAAVSNSHGKKCQASFASWRASRCT